MYGIAVLNIKYVNSTYSAIEEMRRLVQKYGGGYEEYLASKKLQEVTIEDKLQDEADPAIANKQSVMQNAMIPI
jgi:hypothetical protein